MTSKQDRVAEFLKRMGMETPASNSEAALKQLRETFESVEAELRRSEDDPMGPPQDDAARSMKGRPDVTRYRSKGHNVFIRANGAIRIEELPDNWVVLDKPGSDGRKAFDP